ncbi:MAG: hypothetical protein U0326_05910 [Polyangiales bacterium]
MTVAGAPRGGGGGAVAQPGEAAKIASAHRPRRGSRRGLLAVARDDVRGDGGLREDAAGGLEGLDEGGDVSSVTAPRMAFSGMTATAMPCSHSSRHVDDMTLTDLVRPASLQADLRWSRSASLLLLGAGAAGAPSGRRLLQTHT